MGNARRRGRLWGFVSALLALLVLGGPAAALPLVGDKALGSVVGTVTETAGGVTQTVGDTAEATIDTVSEVTGAVQGALQGTVDALAPPAAPALPEQPAAEVQPAPPPPAPAPAAPAPPTVLEPAPAPPAAAVSAPGPAPQAAPSAPPPSLAGELSLDEPGLVGPIAERAGIPLLLLLLVGTFLSVQSWIDRHDPKLAQAPLEAAPDLIFPSASARA